MQQQRERARAAARRGDGVEAERIARFARSAPPSEFVGYGELDVETRGARRRAPCRGPRARQAGALAVLPRGRRPGLGQRRDPGARPARPDRVRIPPGRRPGAARAAGRRAARGRRRPRPRGRSTTPGDDGQPHGHAPAAARVAQPSRRARQAGRLGRAPGRAALRLHAFGARDAGRVAGGRGRGQPGRARGSGAAGLRDLAGGGARARRDDAVRREVRRRRARRGHRGLFDGAVRGHPCALDRRRGSIQRRSRVVGRTGRAAHRGDHRARGAGRAAPRRPRREGGSRCAAHGARAAAGRRVGAQRARARAREGRPRGRRRGWRAGPTCPQ